MARSGVRGVDLGDPWGYLSADHVTPVQVDTWALPWSGARGVSSVCGAPDPCSAPGARCTCCLSLARATRAGPVSRGRICELCAESVRRQPFVSHRRSASVQVTSHFRGDGPVVGIRRLEDSTPGASREGRNPPHRPSLPITNPARPPRSPHEISSATSHRQRRAVSRVLRVSETPVQDRPGASRPSGRARLDGVGGRVSTVWAGASRPSCRARLDGAAGRVSTVMPGASRRCGRARLGEGQRGVPPSSSGGIANTWEMRSASTERTRSTTSPSR